MPNSSLYRLRAARLLVALIAITLSAVLVLPEVMAQSRPKNVILFISDGMGPASVTMARDYVRDVQRGQGLALDAIQVGAVHTYASDNRVTDSAAGATAYSAGVKTYNGAIAVDDQRRPVGTLLEAAEDRGMATGLVVTTRITHATPAAFAAHVPSRAEENEIAVQMMAQGVDVLFGGGRQHFMATGGLRQDGRDLLAEARAAGYEIVEDKAGLLGARRTPVLGLIAHDQLAYEIDRDEQVEPSLAEMTTRALDLLNDDPEGFFLMVEGSRIDHAGHSNDAAANLHETLAYDAAVAAGLEFARRDGETLIVSVSDHETGGLSLGRSGVYSWSPDVLQRVTASLDPMVSAIAGRPAGAAEVLQQRAGITGLNEAEQAALAEAGADASLVRVALVDIISARAGVGWTTSGHTAVDVNLYAFGPGRERFIGSHDNTYVGLTLADLLGLDLRAATAALRAGGGSR